MAGVSDSIVVRALADADREAIATWRYGGEFSIYDPGRGALKLCAPDHVALAHPDGALVGYGTFGRQAQVPGGAYASDRDVVDLGLGLHPNLVGRGYGRVALDALIVDAHRRFAPAIVRVTVAAANRRATALVRRLGFDPTHAFTRSRDGRRFVQYERDVARVTVGAGGS